MADRITQKYLRRWPASKEAMTWAGAMVHIETDRGVWRIDAAGYTFKGRPDAWVLPFEEAQREVNHCGPEKKAAFIRVEPSTAQENRIITGAKEALAHAKGEPTGAVEHTRPAQ